MRISISKTTSGHKQFYSRLFSRLYFFLYVTANSNGKYFIAKSKATKDSQANMYAMVAGNVLNRADGIRVKFFILITSSFFSDESGTYGNNKRHGTEHYAPNSAEKKV